MKGHTFRARRGIVTAAASGRPHEASCFADEVVIDFPSIAPALDRIRTSFLVDERAGAVRASLVLTPREARSGAVLPLQVQVRCTCRDCGGRGEHWSAPCPRCHSTGTEWLTHQVQVSVPAGVLAGDRFHFTVTPRHDAPTRIELEIRISTRNGAKAVPADGDGA
jgi:hypothetical protein